MLENMNKPTRFIAVIVVCFLGIAWFTHQATHPARNHEAAVLIRGLEMNTNNPLQNKAFEAAAKSIDEP